MKYFELDKNEQKLLKDFEKGDFKAVPNVKKELTRYKKYVAVTLNKTRNINIRLSSRDLSKLKAMAVEKGLPYQTLVSSVLHQYSAKKSIKELELV